MRLGTPRPNNGGAREGTGPLRKRVQLKPFAAEKGETISIVDIRIFRCNHCGCIAWNAYTEDVLIDGQFQHIEHVEKLVEHKPGCPVGG